MSDISENEQIEEIKEENIGASPTKTPTPSGIGPLTKPKRQRSQKQIEAFERVKEKRKQNIEAKKKEKLLNSAKLLVESQTDEGLSPPRVPPDRKRNCDHEEIPQVRKKNTRKKIAEPILEESESEEEEIIVKTIRKPKAQQKPKKKKVRKIVIEESETSESDSEESESEDDYPKRKPVARIVRPKQKNGIFFV